jgi:hypothetical protein
VSFILQRIIVISKTTAGEVNGQSRLSETSVSFITEKLADTAVTDVSNEDRNTVKTIHTTKVRARSLTEDKPMSYEKASKYDAVIPMTSEGLMIKVGEYKPLNMTVFLGYR